MAEYIDIDKAIVVIDTRGREIETTVRHILDINKGRYDTDDVVQVVRCKDCKYNLANIPDIQGGMNINENWNACQLTELYDSVEAMDFCSHGAKMEVDNG